MKKFLLSLVLVAALLVPSMNVFAAGGDIYESNNTMGTATLVTLNNTTDTVLNATIDNPSDIDYYKIVLRNRTPVNVICADSYGVDYYLKLYNASGILLASDFQDPYSVEHFELTLDPGTYYIKVNGYNGEYSASPYQLTIDAQI